MINNDFDFVVDTGLKWVRSLSRLKRLDTIVIHPSASDTSTINSIHAHHQRNGHAGCDYNYVITADGIIYKGRGHGLPWRIYAACGIQGASDQRVRA